MNQKHGSKILWAFAAIVIGLSVPYFLIDIGAKSYRSLIDYLGYDKSAEAPAVLPALGSNDADLAEIPEGRHVLVHPASGGQYYFQSADYKVPEVSAKAYMVADVDTGEVIIEKNPDTAFPIASVSKLVTAIVAKKYVDEHVPITVSRSSVEMYGTSGGLRVGEKILATDLYYPLLMESSNDAAEVFAEGYGYDDFITLMNREAKSIGMLSTSFAEPSGLSEKNVSTASDLFKLAQFITKEYPELWDITRVRQYTILKHSWGNSSALARKAEFVGGKNGFTYEAHETTVVILNINMEGGPRRIAVTMLRSDARDADVGALQRFIAKWVGFLPEGETLN